MSLKMGLFMKLIKERKKIALLIIGFVRRVKNLMILILFLFKIRIL
jgi:hypothetical protein